MTQQLMDACLVAVYWLGRNPRDRWHLLPEQEAELLEENLIHVNEIGFQLTEIGLAMVTSRIPAR